jgi:tetratricopeptide (TPR) repeat protein
MVLLGVSELGSQDLESALEEARSAAQNHQYSRVIELLTPFNATTDTEVRYITAAEIGRAYFHLGQYQPAHRAFREAVRLHPERVETAIYLQATAYLMGDEEQALAILREVLKSGAKDLYLTVTLPGERRFLADPKVRAVLDEYTIPLRLDLREGALLGAALGQDRDAVISTLQASSSDPDAAALTATAGPAVIWAFAFGDGQKLTDITVHAWNLHSYTPYRLQVGDEIRWDATPAIAIATLGPPGQTEIREDSLIAMSWSLPSCELVLEFERSSRPQSDDEPGNPAVLKLVRLRRDQKKKAG